MQNAQSERLAGALKWARKWDAKRPESLPQGIYVFECEGFVKIGIASDVKKRLNQAQVGCPFEIRLVAFMLCDNARQRELDMHQKLAPYHVRGEWFKVPMTELSKLL